MSVTEHLLDLLVPSARVALPFVRSMVEKGLTTTAIQQALRPLGVPVRRTDLLALVRGIKDEALARPYIASVRDNLLIDPMRLGAPLTSTLRKFSFQVRLDGLDPDTGEKTSFHVTISSSRNLLKSTVKAAALNMVPNIDEGRAGSPTLPALDDPRATVTGATFDETAP